MKRMIALITVAMFLFAFAAPGALAAAFSDVSGAAQSDIYKLYALNIVHGYPDGTFRPDGNITRAEVAVIAMSAAGLRDSADFLKQSPSKFTDVKVGEWFTGWVNLAASQGCIAGYPDGTFRPNANISYAECITILVRLLGYNEKLPGQWPIEYLVKAAELGITDDVTFTSSALATRANIAILTSQTLDQHLVNWSKDTEDWELKADTLMSAKFDSVVSDEVYGTGFDYDGEEYTLKTSDGNVKCAADFTVAGVATIAATKGRLLEYITNDDDEAIFIDVQDYGVIVDDQATFDKVNKTIKINDKTYDYAADVYMSGCDLATNGKVNFREIKVVLNDDGDAQYIGASNYNVPAVVKEYKAATGDMKYYVAGNQLPEATDLTDANIDTLVIKNGAIKTLADIKAFDLLYEYDISAEHYYWVVDKKVSGKLESSYTASAANGSWEYVTVDGKDYKMGAAVKMSTDNGDNWDPVVLADLYDEEVTLLLGRTGAVEAINASTEGSVSTQYGIVTKVDWTVTDAAGATSTYIKLLKSDGTQASFKMEADMDDEAILTDVSTIVDTFAQFTLNSKGEIDTFKTDYDEFKYMTDSDLTGTLVVADDITDVNTTTHKITTDDGLNLLTGGVVVFNTSYSKAADDDYDSKVESFSTLEDKIDANAPVAATLVVKDGKAEIIVINTAVESAADYAIVTAKGSDVDGDWLKLDGTKYYTTLSINDVYVNDVIEYNLANDEVSAITAQVANNAVSNAYQITDVQGTEVLIKSSAGSSWFTITADTAIFNVTPTTTVKIAKADFDTSYEDSFVVFSANVDDEIEYLVIVDEN